MTVRSINATFGESIIADTPNILATMIRLNGAQLPKDGLKEGRDFETLPSAAEFKVFGGQDVDDNVFFWIFRPCEIKDWSGELVRGWRKVKELHTIDGAIWEACIKKLYMPLETSQEDVAKAFADD